MSITAKGFVPRTVEDVYGDTIGVSADPGVLKNVYVETTMDVDGEDPNSADVALSPFAARQLAAHLIQAAEAVEAAQ